MQCETYLIPDETILQGREGGKGEAFHHRIGCASYLAWHFVGWCVQILGRRLQQCNLKTSLIPGETILRGREGGKGEVFHPGIGCVSYLARHFVG